MNGYLNLSWMECNNNADEILPWLYSLLHCRSVVFFLYIERFGYSGETYTFCIFRLTLMYITHSSGNN